MARWPAPKKLYYSIHLSHLNRGRQAQGMGMEAEGMGAGGMGMDYDPEAMAAEHGVDPQHMPDQMPGMGQRGHRQPQRDAHGHAIDGERVTKTDADYAQMHDEDGMAPNRVRSRDQMHDVHPALRQHDNLVRVNRDN